MSLSNNPVRRGVSAAAAVFAVLLVLMLGWTTFLISTRGWEQWKQDTATSFQNAAYAAKETSHDAALTTKVKAALALSKRIPSAKQIEVTTEGDVITLHGDVPSEQVRNAAESIAEDVPGVGSVQNHLFVVSGDQK
jgi:osmotically-inducible protein OsmY